MPYLMVRQRVEDFEKWHSVFKSHDEAQKKAGLKDFQLLRDNEDPNIVVCFFKVDDLDKAKDFTGSPYAGEAKKKSGVIDEPDVLWLKEI